MKDFPTHFYKTSIILIWILNLLNHQGTPSHFFSEVYKSLRLLKRQYLAESSNLEAWACFIAV